MCAFIQAGGHHEVMVTFERRKGKKFVTIIAGLENFGIRNLPRAHTRVSDSVVFSCDAGLKLKDAAKQLKRKLASSVNITTTPTGQEVLEAQGDKFKELLADMFLMEWNVESLAFSFYSPDDIAKSMFSMLAVILCILMYFNDQLPPDRVFAMEEKRRVPVKNWL